MKKYLSYAIAIIVFIVTYVGVKFMPKVIDAMIIPYAEVARLQQNDTTRTILVSTDTIIIPSSVARVFRHKVITTSKKPKPMKQLAYLP